MTEDNVAPEQIPIVDYLNLSDPPFLTAHQCENCGARFFDRRNACASCGGRSFTEVKVSSEGVLEAFSIVHRAAPTIPVPYVSAIVKTDDGTSVRTNIINTPADPEHVVLGMRVALAAYEAGEDDRGTKCIAFGFEPVERQH